MTHEQITKKPQEKELEKRAEKAIRVGAKWLEDIFIFKYGNKFPLAKIVLENIPRDEPANADDKPNRIGVDIKQVIDFWGKHIDMEDSVEVCSTVVLAHEYAHIWQLFLDPKLDHEPYVNRYNLEQHADYFSGLVIGKYYSRLSEKDKVEVAKFYLNCGGGKHGEEQKRVAIFNQGVTDGQVDFWTNFTRSLEIIKPYINIP